MFRPRVTTIVTDQSKLLPVNQLHS